MDRKSLVLFAWICRFTISFTLIVWMLSTYVLYSKYNETYIFETPVDVAHIGTSDLPSQQTLTLLVQGSDYIRTDVTYSLTLHLTFLDSWTTTTSGLLSFVSDMGNGVHTVSSMMPGIYPPSIWILRHLVLCPLYGMGIIQTTVEKALLLSTGFRSLRDNGPAMKLQNVFSPVADNRNEYVVHVQVTPATGGHMPDLIAVSACFHGTSRSIVDYMTWCWFIAWYIWISTMTILVPIVCTTIQLYHRER